MRGRGCLPRKTKAVAEQLDKLAWIEDQLRQALDEDRRLDEIISKGVQYKTTATGYPALIFETCSCKTYADRRKDHAEDCTVEAVTDPAPIVAAMREKRLNRGQVADLLRLRDEMAPPDYSADVREGMEFFETVAARNTVLEQRVKELESRLAARTVRSDLGDLGDVPAGGAVLHAELTAG
jgi:hypothetical protein